MLTCLKCGTTRERFYWEDKDPMWICDPCKLGVKTAEAAVEMLEKKYTQAVKSPELAGEGDNHDDTHKNAATGQIDPFDAYCGAVKSILSTPPTGREEFCNAVANTDNYNVYILGYLEAVVTLLTHENLAMLAYTSNGREYLREVGELFLSDRTKEWVGKCISVLFSIQRYIRHFDP